MKDAAHRFMTAPTRHPRAFSIPEVMFALTILGLVVAVAIPAIAGYVSMSRARGTAKIFESLGYSLVGNNDQQRTALDGRGFIDTLRNYRGRGGFINSVVDPGLKAPPYATYPARLRHLVIAPTTADLDCTGTNYTATKVTAWNAKSPFSDLLISPGYGVNSPLGVIRDSVYKGSGNTANLIELRLDSVKPQDAQNLDAAIDGDLDSAAGQLRYIQSPTGGAPLRLIKYVLPAYTGC
jgi:prepilin-type N-terminal cleavage/methylation domain-containing protein